MEGVTGWAIGDRVEAGLEPRSDTDDRHATALYKKLAESVIPCYYHDRDRFIETMRHTIALNGGFFNTHRMVGQHLHDAYHIAGEHSRWELSRISDSGQT